jgi:molybdopterin-guanine dinucleotide biosynthesis protein A
VIAVHRADGAAIDGVRTIFEEEHEGEAPIFGVIRALEDAGGRAFVLAVDYPNITTEVLRFVRDRGGIPVWDGEPQLLCAVWDARRLGELRSHVAKGRFDLRGVIGHEMISEAELRSRFGGEPLRNVNTPEEWEGAERGG